LSQIVVAIVFGAIALASAHRPIVAAAALAFEAVFYALLMSSFSRDRVRREVEAARPIVDPAIRDGRTTGLRFVLMTVGVAAIATVSALVTPGSVVVPGIALGGSAESMWFHRWLVGWETERSVEVLRVPAWRRHRGMNDYRVIHRASR
jgi:hypothetical protein